MSHQWVYREDVPAGEMVLLAEVEARFKDGWVDTPAKFVEKPVVKQEVQSAENSADQNDGSELTDMSKEDLKVYAQEQFGVTLNKQKSHANLIKEIEALEAN